MKPPRVAELMECSNETLMVWAEAIKREADRRRLKIDVMEVHPGNVGPDGKPIPPIIRLMPKLVKAPPAVVAKVEALVDALTRPEHRETCGLRLYGPPAACTCS
jgi:hypothetical protein